MLGTAVELEESVRRRAESMLGFPVRYDVVAAGELVERALADPSSFDILSGDASQARVLLEAGAVTPLERERIPYWPRVMSLYKLGRFVPDDPGCATGEGDAPFRLLYAGSRGTGGPPVQWGADSGGAGIGPEPPSVTGSPSTLAIESFAYDSDSIRRRPDELSWAELLNPVHAGRVALQDEPVAGFQQAALAARAAGLLDIASPARPNPGEIDALASLLLDLRSRGHFRAFWSSFDEGVDLLAAREAVLVPLPPPAVVLLRAGSMPVHQAHPPEGYRASAGMLFASRGVAADPSRLQACHDYASWWLSGPAGAVFLRQGYVNAAVQTSLESRAVSQDEWDYWIGGKPAGSDLTTPFGEGSIPAGQEVDGGPLSARACRIAVWRSDLGADADVAAQRWGEVARG